jgi:hypothetical protein
MKKVGLAIVTYKHNYGSMLQSFATQKIISRLGFNPEMIRIEGIDKKIKAAKIKYFIGRIFSFEERKYIYSILRSMRKKRFSTEHARNIAIRNRKYLEFVDNYFNFSRLCSSRSELSAMCTQYAAVVVGSDQLWRPSNIEGDFFTLNFVPAKINKIAYATSFGVAVLPNRQRAKASTFLKRFNHISVREESGRDLVKTLIGHNVPVVCDPSMLLDASDWMEIQPAAPILSEPYILCYFLGDNELYRNFAQRLRNETGYKIIGLLHGAAYIPSDDVFPDYALYDVGPSEFLNLIRNASYICTDSFHGCVFSILHEKQFFSFRRFEEESELSTNDRLNTLFSWTGLKNRLLSGSENVRECIAEEINYYPVSAKVLKMRKESLEYLRNAFGDVNTAK